MVRSSLSSAERARTRSHLRGLFILGAGVVLVGCSPSGSLATGPTPDVPVASDAPATGVDAPTSPADACVPTFHENDLASCSDGIDNDCDGLADCADPNCTRDPSIGACADGGVAGDAGCVRGGPEGDDATCSDGVDNDCNGYTDCRDFACSRNASVRVCCTPSGDEASDALCRDGVDNDCDGYTDCVDFSCSRNPSVSACRPPCAPTGAEGTDAACSDGVDNDCNGYTDCVDFACSRSASVTVCRTGGMPTCSPCRSGSDCVGGVCAVYNDQATPRFCSRRCATDSDCAGTAVTRCSGGICVSASYTYACAAGGGSYTVRDACGLVRTYACTSPERCRMVGARAECAPPASCRGTPTACAARTPGLCGRDCSSSGRCSGSARSCGSYLSSAACRQQDGCNWSGSLSNECRGSANSCSSYSSQYSCGSQNGCSWRLSCTGSPTPCASLSTQVECSGQPGCQWM